METVYAHGFKKKIQTVQTGVLPFFPTTFHCLEVPPLTVSCVSLEINNRAPNTCENDSFLPLISFEITC